MTFQVFGTRESCIVLCAIWGTIKSVISISDAAFNQLLNHDRKDHRLGATSTTFSLKLYII